MNYLQLEIWDICIYIEKGTLQQFVARDRILNIQVYGV